VRVILFADESDLLIPEEIVECFKNEPKNVYETFLTFTEGGQKTYLDWIYDAKTEETKVNRIIRMMDRLKKKLNFYDKEE